MIDGGNGLTSCLLLFRKNKLTTSTGPLPFNSLDQLAESKVKGIEVNIETLFEIIQSRRQNLPAGSYTTRLFQEGLPRIAQKVGEEGTEVVVAALAQDDQRLVEEVADLTFHTLVLLAARGLTPAQVAAELEKRHK
jgi:phosphoribosyl-ATP pyrophosphohydrolase